MCLSPFSHFGTCMKDDESCLGPDQTQSEFHPCRERKVTRGPVRRDLSPPQTPDWVSRSTVTETSAPGEGTGTSDRPPPQSPSVCLLGLRPPTSTRLPPVTDTRQCGSPSVRSEIWSVP